MLLADRVEVCLVLRVVSDPLGLRQVALEPARIHTDAGPDQRACNNNGQPVMLSLFQCDWSAMGAQRTGGTEPPKPGGSAIETTLMDIMATRE